MQYFVANWKMNMDSQKIKTWFDVFNSATAEIPTDKTIIIAPSFPYLQETKNLIQTKNTFVAAQDVDIEDKGAHTGNTGIFQLKEFCQYIIVGHSERKEPLDLVKQKRDLCIANGLTPITCFVNGDTAANIYTDIGLLAWEDPQNISVNGVYRQKDPADILQMTHQIKSKLPVGAKLLYGGSINRENIKDLGANEKIDGVLVGNASLDPEHFLYIIENA